MNDVNGIAPSAPEEAWHSRPFKNNLIFGCIVLVTILAVIALMNAGAYWFVQSEHTIYSHDSIGYWNQSIYVSKAFAVRPLSMFREIWLNARNEEYPLLTVVPLVISASFGYSRLWYILSIVNIFALPSVFLFVILMRKWLKMAWSGLPIVQPENFRSPVAWSITVVPALITIVFDPNYWRPIVNGMPDVGGTILLFLILALSLPHLIQARIRNELLIGVLFFPLAIFRRWYLFWIVGYFAARLIVIALAALRSRNIRLWLGETVKLSLSILVFASCISLLAWPVVERALIPNYSSLYVAWQLPNFTWTLALIDTMRHFGLLLLLLPVGGVVLSFFNPRLRLPALFLILQFLIIWFTFRRTQNFGYHHYYLLLPTLLLFTGYFFSSLSRKVRFPSMMHLVYAFILLALCLLTFYQDLADFRYKILPWPPRNYYPQVRNDIPEIQRLYSTLSILTDGTSEKIYTLTAGGTLNFAHLKYLPVSFPEFPDASNHYLGTQDMDARDGFPSSLFTARYVIVASPLIYHSLPQYSQTLIIPAESILQGSGLGRAFRRLPYEFMIAGPRKVYIYQRTRNITRAEAMELSDALRAKYPNNPYIYSLRVDPKYLTD